MWFVPCKEQDQDVLISCGVIQKSISVQDNTKIYLNHAEICVKLSHIPLVLFWTEMDSSPRLSAFLEHDCS